MHTILQVCGKANSETFETLWTTNNMHVLLVGQIGIRMRSPYQELCSFHVSLILTT